MSEDYSRLRIAIVGAGLMGCWHARYAAQLGARVVAVTDRDRGQGERLSRQLRGDPPVFDDVQAMLSDTRPDVVHICTPVDSHFPLAVTAIDAGAHVLIEKPVADTPGETLTLLEKAEHKGVFVCPVHQFGFQRGVRDALAVMKKMGPVLHVRFVTASAGGTGRAETELDEIVAEILPHPLSLLQRLGMPIAPGDCCWHGVHPQAGELQLVTDAGGTGIDIQISMHARPTRCEMVLSFSKGMIFINFFHGYARIEMGRVSSLQKIVQPFRGTLSEFAVAAMNLAGRGVRREPAYPGLRSLLDECYRAALHGEAPPVPHADTLEVSRLQEELTKRFLAGAPVVGTQY